MKKTDREISGRFFLFKNSRIHPASAGQGFKNWLTRKFFLFGVYRWSLG
jgi:hypothetical protein